MADLGGVVRNGSSAQERALLDALRRMMRRPEDWQVLVFRPALWAEARGPFLRVGHALIEEWASRLAGHAFILDDGDAFLFSREEGEENRLAALRRMLETLFPPTVFAHWSLIRDSAQLVAYLAARLTRMPAPRLIPEAARHSARLEAHRALADPLEGLVQEPVVRLDESGLELVFRLWRPRPQPTWGRNGMGAEERLGLYARALARSAPPPGNGGGAKSEPVAPAPVPAQVFFALTPAAVLDPAFTRLVDLALGRGIGAGVSFPLDELVREPGAGERALARLHARKIAVALEGVTLSHFADLHPPAFGPDWLLLEGGAGLAECDGRELAALLRPLEPGAVVLTGVNDEETLRIGLERGLRFFGGTHAASLAAAGRMLACPAATRCTLPACRDRAAHLAPLFREGCAEPARLDAALSLSAPLPP
jgi:hypothetical protein